MMDEQPILQQDETNSGMGVREGTQHHGCMGITTKAALKERRDLQMPILASSRCRTPTHYCNAKDEETTKSIRPAGTDLWSLRYLRTKADEIKRKLNDGNGRRDNYGYRVCDVGG